MRRDQDEQDRVGYVLFLGHFPYTLPFPAIGVIEFGVPRG